MNIVRLLIILAVLTGCGGSPRHAPLPPGAPVLAFGDSVTFGTGARAGEDYPSRLAALTAWDIHNAGVPGDTAEAARSRIRTALNETRPALVLLEIGGNDFLRRRPQPVVKEDIRALIGLIRQSGARVVLIAVPRLSVMAAVTGGLDDAEIYAELADEENVPLIEDVFSDVLSNGALRSDAIHPNAEGYRVLAEGIAQALDELGMLSGRR